MSAGDSSESPRAPLVATSTKVLIAVTVGCTAFVTYKVNTWWRKWQAERQEAAEKRKKLMLAVCAGVVVGGALTLYAGYKIRGALRKSDADRDR